MIQLSTGKKPTSTDYLAAAILSYGIVYFWVQFILILGVNWLSYLSYPVFLLTASATSFLVLKRADEAHLAVGLKSSLISWVFTVVSFTALTEGTNTSFFLVLLVCFILGGAASAYVKLKKRLNPVSKPEQDDTS